jgi:hypothetical protein
MKVVVHSPAPRVYPAILHVIVEIDIGTIMPSPTQQFLQNLLNARGQAGIFLPGEK